MKAADVLAKFREDTEDLWDQFMEGDDPDPQRYDGFLDNAYKEAQAALYDLCIAAMPAKLNPPDGQTPLSMGHNQAIDQCTEALQRVFQQGDN